MQTFDSQGNSGQWMTGDVMVQGVRLHYTRTGGDLPPLVLAHGFSDDGLCWTPVAQALEAHFDVVMVDARGHGYSQAPDDGYNAAETAHDLAGVISALELHSPIIMGHSMGASTALTLTTLYPQLPRAILLEDPPAWWRKPAPTAATNKPDNNDWQRNTRAWILDLKTQSREQLIEKQGRAAPSWSQLEVELWADAHLRLSPNVLNGRTLSEERDLSLLANITCPTLLITAEPELGAIVTSSDAIALQQLIPHLKTVHIAGAGHSIHREQFGPFMNAVQAFLNDIAIL
ncbi:alpha/beta hydrolase [bacterium]|nr:MAG: alpha/beta hydrolase [bacterium]